MAFVNTGCRSLTDVVFNCNIPAVSVGQVNHIPVMQCAQDTASWTPDFMHFIENCGGGHLPLRKCDEPLIAAVKSFGGQGTVRSEN